MALLDCLILPSKFLIFKEILHCKGLEVFLVGWFYIVVICLFLIKKSYFERNCGMKNGSLLSGLFPVFRKKICETVTLGS